MNRPSSKPPPSRGGRIVQMYHDSLSIARNAAECGIGKVSVIRIRAAEKQ